MTCPWLHGESVAGVVSSLNPICGQGDQGYLGIKDLV